MGVYEHMARPSMGHRLQVELRDSMERYHHNKEYLQHHMAKLRLHSRDLHTSPLPPSPEPPLKRWGEPGSKFSQAPEVAAQKARLAQLEKDNSPQRGDNELKASNTLLPPIDEGSPPGSHKGKTGAEQTGTTPKDPAKKSGSAKPAPKTVQTRNAFKGRKFQKKQQGAVKKPAQPKDRPLPLLKLPTIYSATARRSRWDSGCNHIHVHGQSTHLEKNQVDEECRNFTQRSVTIPAIRDAKRTEIHRPLNVQQMSTAKVQFKRHPTTLVPGNAEVGHSTPAEHPPTRQHTVDHFPTPRVPQVDDDDSSDGAETDEEAEDSADRDKRTTLPAIPVTQPAKPTSKYQPLMQAVPPLRLQRGLTPSAISTNTARSGATAASYMSLMSQETQEWKGAYMNSDDPHHKGRMLMEILFATRQRMHDNEEELRLTGDYQGPGDKWDAGLRSDVMLLHRDGTMDSGATTARSSGNQQKPLKLPHHHHHKKRAGGDRQSNNSSKLHRYLSRLTHQRKGGEQRQRGERHHAPFQLSTMPIREITQSSLGHQSAVHTAS